MPDWLLGFPNFLQIPMAQWVDTILTWVLTNWAPFFYTISKVLLYLLLFIEKFLLWIPWLVIVILIGIIAWFVTRLWWAGLLMAAFLIIIGSLGYWESSMMTLAIIISAVIISLAIGIPIGIVMAKSNPVEYIIRPVVNAMQTIPSFVYLIPALMLFGLGSVPAVFATIIYAMPPVIRLTNIGIRQIPNSIIEAAQAFGSSRWQILFEVQVPLAVPAIIVGINRTIMMGLTMAIIASLIGARGLGLEALTAIGNIQAGRAFAAGFSIVLLAVIIDRITHILSSRLEYRGTDLIYAATPHK